MSRQNFPERRVGFLKQRMPTEYTCTSRYTCKYEMCEIVRKGFRLHPEFPEGVRHLCSTTDELPPPELVKNTAINDAANILKKGGELS